MNSWEAIVSKEDVLGAAKFGFGFGFGFGFTSDPI